MTKAKIFYHDIGDYLSREEKLNIVQKFGSMANMPWQELTPNEHGDWISMRNESFDTFIPMATEKKYDLKSNSFFVAHSLGTVTARDSWVYNFSEKKLKQNISKTIHHYNQQRLAVASGSQKEFLPDSKLGSWSRDWQNQIKRNYEIVEDEEQYLTTIYRPFIKTNSYFHDDLNQERYQLTKQGKLTL